MFAPSMTTAGVGLAERMAQGAAALGVPLDTGALRKMLDYVGLVARCTRAYSLTAAHNSERILDVHLLGCLAAVPHLPDGTVADVGSGAGLPGIPLAIARPRQAVTLIESDHGKSAFLHRAVRELGLENVEVIGERVQAWQVRRPFDTVISRALSDLKEFAQLAGRLCADTGTLAAIKAVYPHEELAQLPVTFRLRSVVPLEIPGVTAAHHLVLLDPVRQAPGRDEITPP